MLGKVVKAATKSCNAQCNGRHTAVISDLTSLLRYVDL